MKKETYNRILTLHITALEEQLNTEMCKLNETELIHLAEITSSEYPKLARMAKEFLKD